MANSDRAATSDAKQPANPLDWQQAIATGRRMAPTGPRVSPRQARGAVEDLRACAREAEEHVRETTGLGSDVPIAQAEIVDRRGWVTATAEGMAELTTPFTSRLVSVSESGARAAGRQVGALLGYLSSRVLGQYDPIGGGGRLLLVAPNIIKVEREIGAAPADFRLWVCLHESTHRLQFTANPWLVQHFRYLVDTYAAMAPASASDLFDGVMRAIRNRKVDAEPDAADTGGRHTPAAPGETWLHRIQTAEQRPVFDSLMSLMTLLEGHADYVMDAVGPVVVPSVHEIRDAFSARRRKGKGPLDRIVRTVLGMDAKLSQYIKGADFVRAVVDDVGMEGFNRVWTSAQTLPSMLEITQPEQWISRVHDSEI